MPTRADVVSAARGQIGVPWMHQARLPGVALDCAGLVICVAQSLGCLDPDFDISDYPRQPNGQLLGICDANMVRINALELGAVILVAVENEPQHIGIIGDYRHGGWSIIHAASNAKPGRVLETRLMFGPGMILHAVYRLRGVA